VTRSLIWVAPVFLYIRYIDKRSPVTYLKLKQNWRRGVLIGLLVSAVNLIGSMIRFGLPHPSISSVTWNTILSTSFAIGFIEEVPFRGFLLQKFEEQVGYAFANLLSSALFLAIHLPGWLSLRTFRLVDAGIVFVIGVVLAIVFKCSGSLWSSAIAHSSNDLYAAVLFRS
jgi:membrane protease YdiL (CAAX protease family)